MKQFILLFICISISYNTVAQQSTLLEGYIQEGIAGNHILKQQGFQVQKAVYALAEAKALFKPTVGFNATYSTAQGGRALSFPVGDLLNPVYSTLNQLTRSSAFPQIENVNEQLVPKNFLDYRLKTQMPIINAEIRYNYEIKKQMISLQQIEIQVFKKELTKDIKLAYFNFLKASQALGIYENGIKILQESERVNKTLIANGMANPTVLMRSQNEISRIMDEKLAAENTRKNAAAYFNFLLNKDFQASIAIDSILIGQEVPVFVGSGHGHREELDKLAAAQQINQTILKLNQSYKKPKLGGILDLGSQGTATTFNTKNFFALLGLSLDVPIYAGGRNLQKIKQTEMEIASLGEQTKQVEEQLLLQNTLAQNSLNAARAIAQSKAGQVATGQRYYRDLLKRYKEGQANFIELLDAQTQLTNAQLQQSVARFDVWLRYVELERTLNN